MWHTCLILLTALLAFGDTPDKVIDAVNAVESWQQVGQQPYEFTWTTRQEHPRVLVDFEDLAGWKLELYAGAQGEFRRSREQQMWGQHVGKLVFSGTGKTSRMVARPPKPMPITGKFDSVDLWGYGNHWGWEADKSTPPVDVSVLVTDARGREFPIELTDLRWKQWWLIHRKVPAKTAGEMVLPVSFTGLQISRIANTAQRYFYCDSLAFYQEELNPLVFAPQPRRNLAPFRGQIVGLNTGAGTLPFPTREETILPANLEKNFRVTAHQKKRNDFEFEYRGRDARVVYAYQPKGGSLSEISVRVNGAAAFQPLDGGRVRFADSPDGELISSTLAGDVVQARFRYGSRLVEYHLRLWQKSLVLEVWCDGGEATALDLGRVAGVRNPRLITVPYLTYGRTANPRVLLSGAAVQPVFTSVWFDWYRTNASEPFTPKEPKVSESSAEINGGLSYNLLTNGLRNNLYERIFVTNSPVYEEVLPTIANPPSLRQAEGKEVLWTVTAPATWKEDRESSRRIRSYGIDKIMQHSHEVTWRDEGDSFTLRLHAAPQKGGDAGLQQYVRAQNEMGWLQGVYTNYTDFASVNSNWNPDWVQRTSDGEWRRAWARCYALKPAKAVEFDDYYAQRIQQKFGVRMSYTDVHTAVGPWQYCDYDARVPGAGTMAATFYAYGQLLLNDQRVYGPTQSEATYQWLYAGLESGSYGWVYTDLNLLTHPPDVAFQLTKIHPLEADYGMGYTFYYLEKIDKAWTTSPQRREYLDLFLATTIAYGNLGWLAREFGDNAFGVEAMARSYYMLQQLQQQYAFVRPRSIEYADAAGTFVSASQAHATGAITQARVHVSYENGTEVLVNRNPTQPWAVKDRQGRVVDLPPNGWLAFNDAAGVYEVSANMSGRRVDYVKAPGYEFLDGRGQWTERGNLGVAGSVVRRERSGGRLELIDLYGNHRIAFQAQPDGALTAYDAEDRSLGQAQLSSPRAGWKEFKPVAGGRKYIFAPRAQPLP